MKITPPRLKQECGNIKVVAKAPRSSNLELYRILCMLMIVAHHYVCNLIDQLRIATAENAVFRWYDNSSQGRQVCC